MTVHAFRVVGAGHGTREEFRVGTCHTGLLP